MSETEATHDGDTVTLSDVDELSSKKVSVNGNLYVGTGYGGREVTYVLRDEGEPSDDDEQTETND
jgi:hypothetical protein